VNYSFIVNREDWEFGIDDSWSAIFFIDAAESEEEKLEDLTKDLNCHIESASKLIDELKGLVSNYLDILVLVAGMLLIVTVTIFYTVIRSDLTNRRTEMYLYRVFGASFHKAQKVIFYEYTIIALITSFAVSFTIMLCGELYFYYGLKKHFPLSIPIIIMTTAIVVLFIFLCCQMAGLENLKRTGLEAVRDE
jgi:predicted lysophospholipase L1 biosynthesis ABC-type transport system permease subunit